MTRVRLVAFSIALVACGAPEASSTDAGVVGEAGAAAIAVRGDVIDAQGAPWASALVQVCSETLCTLGNADAQGAFSVQVPAGDRYHVIARPSPSDAREGSAGFFVQSAVLTSDTALGAPIPIPITGAHVAADASGSISGNVASDLALSASASDVAFYGDAYFAGASVPESAWPAFSIEGKTILAMWALNPWATHANPNATIAVTIANHFGLAANDVASVYVVNETTAELGAANVATVSADGASIASSVDRLTWIVLAH